MGKATVYECSLPYEKSRIHAAAVYCSDGSLTEQMDEFMHHGLGQQVYDRLAVPGGPSCLAGRHVTAMKGHVVEHALRFLIRAHELSLVVLITHEGCAHYREKLGVAEHAMVSEQRRDLEKAARAVAGLRAGLDVRAFLTRASGGRVRIEAA
jgi:hypothetical protein